MDKLEPFAVFEGRKFAVMKVEVFGKSGSRFLREYVHHPGAVVILPFFNNYIVAIRNRRFTIGKWVLELPAGTLNKNEEPLQCANRELIEETGYVAKNIVPLTKFYPTPGYSDEIIHAFVATGLTFVGQRLEETEQIETVLIKPHNFEELIEMNTIIDGKTILTYLFYKTFEINESVNEKEK